MRVKKEDKDVIHSHYNIYFIVASHNTVHAGAVESAED
jgi:hypothetical protein